MSKVDELREKYSKVTHATFNKFLEADTTPTKKYLEYFLKSWSLRGQNCCPNTTDGLIRLVKEFDSLLPYVSNKDIYTKEFTDLSYLKVVIARAEEIKEEKTFVRDEHVFVLEENDEYILLQPLTHRGSLRYGAQTRWCTASKNDPGVFNRYTKGGLLLYLIDKQGTKGSNYKKIAFHASYSDDILTGNINTFNTIDNPTYGEHLIQGGWKEEVVLRVTTLYRILHRKEKLLKKSKDYVQSFSDNLSKLNFQSLVEHLGILEQNRKIDYTSTLENQINDLIKNLNKLNYATRPTT